MSDFNQDDEEIDLAEIIEEQEVIASELPEIPQLEGAIGAKICLACKEQNLQKEIHIQTCLRCDEIYCVHFASSVDPAYCSDCNHKIELTDQTFTRTDTVLSEDGKKKTERVSKSRQLIFSGLDWLFFQRKIYSLSDTELSLAIEYHHTIEQSMLAERDKRKIEYFHRNAGKNVMRISTGDTINSNSTSTTVKSSKTTRAVKQDKSEVQLKSLLETLTKSGLSMNQIAAMLKK